MDDQEARETVARVETLLEEVEALADPAGREKAGELVQSLVELYGEGLARIMERVGEQERSALAQDELLSHLLLLHDLHPVTLEDRVLDALAGVAPYLESHGGGVELTGVEDGVVRLRLEGSCSGCPSSTMTLKLAIEEAIQKVAPDVEKIEAEGVSAPAAAPLVQIGGSPPPPPTGPTLIQLEVPGAPASNGAQPTADGGEPWAMAGSLQELSGGGTLVKRVSGEPILFLRLVDTFYGYRPRCPGCEESLEGAALHGSELSCPGCGRRYDAQRAGRCLDDPQLFLEPVPLLVADSGLVKVAIGSAVA